MMSTLVWPKRCTTSGARTPVMPGNWPKRLCRVTCRLPGGARLPALQRFKAGWTTKPADATLTVTQMIDVGLRVSRQGSQPLTLAWAAPNRLDEIDSSDASYPAVHPNRG